MKFHKLKYLGLISKVYNVANQLINALPVCIQLINLNVSVVW